MPLRLNIGVGTFGGDMEKEHIQKLGNSQPEIIPSVIDGLALALIDSGAFLLVGC